MGREVMQFLAGSACRPAILRALREERRDASGLRDAISGSRSTVHRNLTKLRARGWVGETSERAYMLTPLGRRVITRYDECLAVFEHFTEYDDFLSTIPAELVPPQLPDPDNATYQTRATDRPHSLLEQYLAALRGLDGDSVLAFVWTLSSFHVDAIEDLLESGVDLTLLVRPDDVQSLDSRTQAMFERDTTTVLEYTSDWRADIVLSGDTVVLATYDTEGHIQTFLGTAEDSVRSWIHEMLLRCREQATPSRGGGGLL